MADPTTDTQQENSQDDVRAGGLDTLKWINQNLLRSDILLALSVVSLLVVLVLPMPTWALDIALAFSITFSILILMTSLFIEKPLEFNTFPTILLLATMLRLSLNLASTRLILAEGHNGTGAAGKVIEAFGGFVMGGNFVIGIIVFAILVIGVWKLLTRRLASVLSSQYQNYVLQI